MPTPQQVLRAIDDFEIAAQWCAATGKVEGEYWRFVQAEYDRNDTSTVLVTWAELDDMISWPDGEPVYVHWPVHLDELEIERDPVYVGLWRWQHEQAMGRV